jgi:hypothetical protein
VGKKTVVEICQNVFLLIEKLLTILKLIWLAVETQEITKSFIFSLPQQHLKQTN